MKLFFNGVSYTVAKDEDQATEHLMTLTDCDRSEAIQDGWKEVPADKPITIRIVDADEGEPESETHTAAEWVALNARRAPVEIASTEW